MTDELDRRLDAALRALPEIDVADLGRARIRRRALDELEKSRASPWMSAMARLYGLVLEPALVFGVGPLYLVWAFATVLGVYRAAG